MDPKTKISRLLCIYVFDFDIPQGTFNGACQGHLPKYGIGAILYINPHITFTDDMILVEALI